MSENRPEALYHLLFLFLFNSLPQVLLYRIDIVHSFGAVNKTFQRQETRVTNNDKNYSKNTGDRFLKKLWCCVAGEFNKIPISLRWPIHIINPVDKTNLSCNAPTNAATPFLQKLTPFILLSTSFSFLKWTENILKTQHFENDDVTIIT